MEGVSETALEPPLQELTIDGLLSFGSPTTFEFGSLNILVGPNGCGKSNLLDILRVLQKSPTDIQSAFSDVGFEEWLYKGGNTQTASLDALITLAPSMAVRHWLRFGPPLRSAARIDEIVEYRDAAPGYTDPVFFFKSQNGRPVLNYWLEDENKRVPRRLKEDEYDPMQSVLAQFREAVKFREITRLGQFYAATRFYSQWSFGRTSLLRESTTVDRTDTTLSEAMADLPLALNGLMGTSAHDAIREYLRDIKESYGDYVTRILFGRVGLELSERPFERPIAAKRLSDGTLRFLALAAILLNTSPPPLICLEEPELGMHPDMVRVIADMLVSAAARTQVIVTTHSENLLTALQDRFDVLFAFDWGPDGTVVRRLTHTEYSHYRADHPLGDLWSSGELGGVRW